MTELFPETEVMERPQMAEPAKALAQIEPAASPAPIDQATAIVSLIERAARDPDIDIDKMERLLAMQERVIERRAKEAFDTAMAEMQPSLPIISERGTNTNTSQSYSLWEDIQEAIKPVLARHGFALTFRTSRTEALVSVTAVLSHREGHREETSIELPVDTGPGRNAVQAVGSSTSYGQRYTAKLLLNLTSRGGDDDGKAAGASAAVEAAIAAVNFCNTLDDMRAWKTKSAEIIPTLPTADQNTIIRHFTNRWNRMKAAGGEAE